MRISNQRLFMMLIGVVTTIMPISAMPQHAVTPQYESDGSLKIPTGYQKWVFVGSNLGLGYNATLPEMTAAEAVREQEGEFHNIYISPQAFEAFSQTGTFPDPTILVMEHYVAQDREPTGVLTEGVFNGARSGLEVAVKNANRPDGSNTPWAYYVFTDPDDPNTVLPTARAFPDGACFQCHLEHASTDNVWVQFYPILRSR